MGPYFGFQSVLAIFLLDLLATFTDSPVTYGISLSLALLAGALVVFLEFLRFEKRSFGLRLSSAIFKGILATILVAVPLPLLGILALIGFLAFFTFDPGRRRSDTTIVFKI